MTETTPPQGAGAKSPTAPKKTKKTTKKTSRAKTSSGRGSKSASNLVIVESPAKAKTIEKYLGKDFRVLASVGHVIDLPKSKLGVDIENDFEPEYVTIRGKKKVLDELKKAAAKAERVYLATDPDREGEAIAWHVKNYLKVDDTIVNRATFNEITRDAVREAIDHPSKLDMSLCMAQQTRRILDRLVGYQISPLLWSNVRRGLSAGRVQSVAVRILCEREAEIRAFKADEYWTIQIEVEGPKPPQFKIRLAKVDGEKPTIPNQETAEAIVAACRDQALQVASVEKKPLKRNPKAPFITSSLQQEAARKLRFSPSRTMRIAQGLYEGVNIGSDGTVGLITYMRTDSTRSAESAIQAARGFIAERYGENYVPESANRYASNKGAQDAHEAIRPTLLDHPPEALQQYLDPDQLKLYRLIWNRFVASQMAPAQLERTTVEVPVRDGKYLFVATGTVVKFNGFLAVYEEGHDERDGQQTTEEETANKLPQMQQGDALKPLEFLPEQHFTQPPPRFSQSSLIRELEKRGIGRPSTYAAIIQTIQDKKYAEVEKTYFHPTELGEIVTDILVDSFPDILDPTFTAEMETELDEIEEGDRPWLEVMRDFYTKFAARLEHAKEHMKSPKTEVEETDIECDKCGAMMVIRWGRNGKFLSCSKYPDCKNAKQFTVDDDGKIVPEEQPQTDEMCDKCGAPMVVKSGRNGRFLACSNYPECKTTRNIAEVENGKAVAQAAEDLPETDEVCEKCGSKMIVRNSRRGPFIACPGYPKCRNAKSIAEVRDGKAIAEKLPETDEKCDKCGAPMAVKKGKRGLFLACTAFPKCRNAKPYKEDEGEDGGEKKEE